MLLVVTDCETTGLEETDQVCEIAISTISDKMIISFWDTLVKPTCPMSIGARATHHITDEELANAPTMTALLLQRGLPEFGQPSDEFRSNRIFPNPDDVVFVAHNAGYDRRMFVQSGVHPDLLPKQTICTWRCALHLWPEMEKHTNQFLRYALDVKPALTGLPHRAAADVAVTTSILLKMLETHSPEQLIELTTTPVLLGKVSFGQHRGKLWKARYCTSRTQVIQPARGGE